MADNTIGIGLLVTVFLLVAFPLIYFRSKKYNIKWTGMRLLIGFSMLILVLSVLVISTGSGFAGGTIYGVDSIAIYALSLGIVWGSWGIPLLVLSLILFTIGKKSEKKKAILASKILLAISLLGFMALSFYLVINNIR